MLSDVLYAVSENSQVSGGVDTRAYWQEHESPKTELYGLFLNYRKVVPDDLGDRWIISLQGDAEHDLKEIRSYQSFLQYKGPLGRWNVRAGHFILPFGLLNDLDTERLLLQSKEEETIGVKLDTGVSVFGFVDDWNWALALTSGVGRRWLNDYDKTYLSTIRLSRKIDDFSFGGSILIGDLRPDDDFPVKSENVRQQKLAIDGLFELGQTTARLELMGGKEEQDSMGAVQAFIDHQLSGLWELNLKASSIYRDRPQHELAAGVGVRPWSGWVFRAADFYRFFPERNNNEFKIQVAYEFSQSL